RNVSTRLSDSVEKHRGLSSRLHAQEGIREPAFPLSEQQVSLKTERSDSSRQQISPSSTAPFRLGGVRLSRSQVRRNRGRRFCQFLAAPSPSVFVPNPWNEPEKNREGTSCFMIECPTEFSQPGSTFAGFPDATL